MDEALDAMERNPNDPCSYFLNRDTGTVVVRVDEDYDSESDEAREEIDKAPPGRFERIPQVHTEYGWMRDFAKTVDDDELRARLEDALSGRGAFGRFRDVVFGDHELRSLWLHTKQPCVKTRISPPKRRTPAFSPGLEIRAKGGTRTLTGVTPLAPQRINGPSEIRHFASLERTEAHRNAPKYPETGEHPPLDFGDPATLLVAEARALLAAAESGEPVSAGRARAFARACVEVTEVGRLAVAVMDGGVFAGARLVELATRVLSDQAGLASTSGVTDGNGTRQ